jgi:predicted Zn-dependent protease
MALSAETSQQLETLGYVVPASTGAQLPPELESFEPSGRDPRDLADDLQKFIHAGGALELGQNEMALPSFEQLAKRFPDSTRILDRTLEAQLALGRSDDAIATLRRGVAIDPEQHRYWSNLGELLVRRGDAKGAEPVLRETLRRWPCDALARTQLSHLLADQKTSGAARVQLLEEGLAACSDPPELMNELAYVLATHPDAARRDGARALTLARRATAALADNPLVLDTLAAAQAESGDFDAALATARRAVALASSQNLPAAALDVLRGHQEAIEQNRPIRE